jgi:DNA-binding transcriptional LysR family regulator
MACVDVEHRIVFGLSGFHERLAQHLADGVDRDVDAAERVDGRVEELLDIGGHSQVALHLDVPTSELATAVVGYDRVRLAVPAEHPLAGRATADITEVAGERIALWAPPGASYYSDFLMGACRRAGFEPDYVVSRVQGAATVAAPLTTGAVAFVTTPAGPAMARRVAVIDLDPPLLVPIQALWQRHTASAVRDAILADEPHSAVKDRGK